MLQASGLFLWLHVNSQFLRLRAKRFGETSPELADDGCGKRRRAIPNSQIGWLEATG